MTLPLSSETDAAAALLRPGRRVHLMGIGGVGMAGLAVLLRERGCLVSGCDTGGGELLRRLAASGLSVLRGHDPAHLKGMDGLVRSSAVPSDHPEAATALGRGLPVCRRGAALAALVRERPSIAVSGTHGKSTTSAMIAQVLEACGLPADCCIGAEVEALGGTARAGHGNTLVVEADESDGSVALYEADVAVITNVEYDHMEHFADVGALEACLEKFAALARRRLVYCADDPVSRRLFREHPRAWSFGLGAEADWRGEILERKADGLLMRLRRRGREWGLTRLPVGGSHNALNALACAAACAEWGADHGAILEALSRFRPARRRFETVCQARGIRVISDYAHHPSEVKAVIEVALELAPGRLVAVFQPHRFSRTRALRTAFPPAFAGVDRLLLTPVYAASEAPLEGGTTADLMAAFRAWGKVPAEETASLEEAWERINSSLRPGDVLLVIGAGDVDRLAWQARDAILDPDPKSRNQLPSE